MRNLLAFMAALTLVVGGLGLYLGWFKVQTTPGTDGHTNINIDFNGVKASEDAAKAVSKVNDLAQSLAEKQKKEQEEKSKSTPAPAPAKPQDSWIQF